MNLYSRLCMWIFSSTLLRAVAIVCACTHITKETEDPIKLLPSIIIGNKFLNLRISRIYAHIYVYMYTLRTKLVKCYIWSIALYGVETLTLRNTWKV
jgi:hypothetical protein